MGAMTFAPSTFAMGAVIGFVLALTGAGGGVLAVPLLVFGTGVGVRQAAPLALIAVGASAAIGAVLGFRDGKLRYRAALVIGAAGMLAAPFGVNVAAIVPDAPLTLCFAAAMVWTAARMFRAKSREIAATQIREVPCALDRSTGRLAWTPRCAVVLASIGVIAGFLGGLLGVGGGFVIVPSLSRLSDLELDAIVSTSLAVIAMVSLAAMTSAAGQGALNWQMAGPFALGAASTLVASRKLVSQWQRKTSQRLFGALCLATAVILALRGLPGIQP
jgi:hypothetical protein